MRKNPFFPGIVLLLLSACASAADSATPTAAPVALPQPTATMTIPTPASPGDPIVWEGLQVTMDGLEVSQDYVTEYGSTRIPPAGQKFLWVHLRLQNTGQTEMEIPLLEHFSVLYSAAELKPTYGHRREYPDYTALGSVIFPGQQLDGWLRFDIPATAALKELRLVFLPESAQVGASYSSPSYPYAQDKPTFVWNGAR